MQVSGINFSLPRVQKNNISFKNNINEDMVTIMDYQEITDLKKFAKECDDNDALKIYKGSYIDSKFVKSQSDLIEDKGDWLDITNYDNM